ncbi:MAG: preprotein translocase subunit SecG [Ignavibacteriaceae bacterium]|nr:preprotein translocase subunit SecG [Ignavibacteriaceae bacterium]
MFGILLTITVILALVLLLMVLMQSSKGGGLAGTFGGAQQMGTMFGTRRTADFLSKATWWLGGSLAVLALVINLFFLPSSSVEGRDSSVQKGGRSSVPTAPGNLPPTTPGN